MLVDYIISHRAAWVTYHAMVMVWNGLCNAYFHRSCVLLVECIQLLMTNDMYGFMLDAFDLFNV